MSENCQIVANNLTATRRINIAKQNRYISCCSGLTRQSDHDETKPSFNAKGNQENHVSSKCSNMLNNARNLRLHSIDVHNNDNKTKSYTCDKCCKIFTRFDSLKIHKNSVHNPAKNFKCDKCSRTFTLRHSLKRHENVFHKEGNSEDLANRSFECDNCHKTFNRKDTLVFHVRNCYNLYKNCREDFVCSICWKAFPLKHYLKEHLKKNHTNSKILECENCGRKFARKNNFHSHIKNCYRKRENSHLSHSTDELKCVSCGNQFPRKTDILNHILREHKEINIEHDHHFFSSVSEFCDWKLKMEKATITYYRKRFAKELKEYRLSSFRCHRSGSYQPRSYGRTRKLKTQGTKKINGYCPAEILVRENLSTGVCQVSHVKTHVGHQVGDINELAHISLTKQERVNIASKISAGASFEEILDENAKSSITCPSDRLSLLNNKDLHNIASTFGLKNIPLTPSFTNPVNMDSFVVEYKDCILYYKPQKQLDPVYPALLENDIVLIMMSDMQKEMIQQYGYMVTAMEKIPARDFVIPLLLILNNLGEGLAVAFAISNRDDEILVEIFLSCIKEEVGLCPTRLLLTDKQTSFLGCWQKIMLPPTNAVYCLWLVAEKWQKNLMKIANFEKRSQMRQRLNNLMSLQDENEFNSQLTELMNETDPDLQDFLDYFQKYFYFNCDQWAYCYRKLVDIDANKYVQAFDRTLKYFHELLAKVDSFSSCLHILQKYSVLKENLVYEHQISGELPFKIRQLRLRHDEVRSKNVDVMVLRSDIDGGWFVSVSKSEEKKLYFVNLVDENCKKCEYYCEQCDACVHNYGCSCLDYTIKGNMCKHIHGLCMTLKNLKENEELEAPMMIVGEFSDCVPEVMQVEEAPIVEVSQVPIDDEDRLRTSFESLVQKAKCNPGSMDIVQQLVNSGFTAIEAQDGGSVQISVLIQKS